METITIADVHAHILPGLDDGSKSWEETGKMLELAISMGIRTIIATPHYSRHLEIGKVIEYVQRTSEEAKKRCAELHIYSGQEILYFDSMVECLKEGKAMTLAQTRYVLVEFMPGAVYQKIYQGIRNIQLGGYYPVLAHVERYEALRTAGRLSELRDLGCLLQMNYSSLQGHMFDKNVTWCRKQLQAEAIDLMGTDMHHSDVRSPEIQKSLNWLSSHLSQEYLESITSGQAIKIIGSKSKDKKNVT